MAETKKTSAGKKSAPAAKKPAGDKAPAATEKTSSTSGAAAKSAAAPARPARGSAAAGPKPTATPGGTADLLGFEPYQEQRGEEYMNEAQAAHFRRILQNWKRSLMEEVDRTLQHMQEEVANYADPNDRASQESDFTLELRARDRERKLIKKIDEALQAIDEGEYGYCEACGCEIGIRRLEARPTATLCIDCKTLDEIRERQRAG